MNNFGNLKIDYLSLNLQSNNIKQIKKVADFLINLGCESRLVDQFIAKLYLLTKIHKSLYLDEFVVNLNKYWKRTSLCFKEKHAQCFYHDLRFQQLD